MKFITSTAVALLAASASALTIRSDGSRTVVFTNEQSGHGQAADIPTNNHPVSVKANYPELYNPFHVDSIMITSGVVEGANCKVTGKNAQGHWIDVVSVNGRQNYAKFPQDTGVVPHTLNIACV